MDRIGDFVPLWTLFDSILYILKATLEKIWGSFQDVVNIVYNLNFIVRLLEYHVLLTEYLISYHLPYTPPPN